MGYRAVALSQVDGAGGESIGHQLAHKLGFGYLNEAIVTQVARDHGVDPSIVAEAERRKSFFTRVAEMAARGAVVSLGLSPAHPGAGLPPRFRTARHGSGVHEPVGRPAAAPARPGGPVSRQARGPVPWPAEEPLAAPGPTRG